MGLALQENGQQKTPPRRGFSSAGECRPTVGTDHDADQFALWMARLLTAIAASWITSDSDG